MTLWCMGVDLTSLTVLLVSENILGIFYFLEKNKFLSSWDETFRLLTSREFQKNI